MDWKALCELLPQPVFLVREEQVVWCNGACYGLVAEGMSLRELIADGNTLFSLRDRTQTARLPILLASACPAHASVCALEEGDLFVVSCADTQGAVSGSAAGASVALRRSLNSAVNASRRLFSMLDDYDDSMLMQEASALNRSLYQLMRLCSQLSDGELLLRHRQTAHRELTDLSAFLRDFTQSAAALLEGSGRTLTLQIPNEPIRGAVDRALLERALYNLLSNSLRFTPHGGHIEIRAEPSGKELLVCFLDDGEGIPPAALASLFEVSGEPSPDPRRGLGLGLSMVREIVRLHDGTIGVSANPSGKGTCVRFTLSLRTDFLLLRSRKPLFDYCGEFHHGLVELSDVLDAQCYDPRQVR